MHSLPLFVKLAGRPVILLGNGAAADAKRRLLERAGAVVSDEDAEAVLAVVAIDGEDEALAAIARLKQRGILVNAVDRPTFCDFTLPAILDRDPVLIAFGTGGASAGLAKALRQRFETLLPETVGGLAEQLLEARSAIKVKWSEGAERRRMIDAALADCGVLDPFSATEEDAVAIWLSGKTAVKATGIYEINLRSDDPEDLTLREARLLGSADMIYASKNVPEPILNRARADANRIIGDMVDDLPPDNVVILLRAFDD